MDLLLFPETDATEADDVLMLRIAKKYGAMIVSKDQFRNHEFPDQIRNNTIFYDLVDDRDFPHKIRSTLKTKLIFNKSVIFNADPGKRFISRLSFLLNKLIPFSENLLVSPGDDDYQSVKKSLEIFDLDLEKVMFNLNLLYLYIFSCARYIYGYGIHSQVFFMPKDQHFPMDWWDFHLHLVHHEDDE